MNSVEKRCTICINTTTIVCKNRANGVKIVDILAAAADVFRNETRRNMTFEK